MAFRLVTAIAIATFVLLGDESTSSRDIALPRARADKGASVTLIGTVLIQAAIRAIAHLASTQLASVLAVGTASGAVFLDVAVRAGPRSPDIFTAGFLFGPQLVTGVPARGFPVPSAVTNVVVARSTTTGTSFIGSNRGWHCAQSGRGRDRGGIRGPSTHCGGLRWRITGRRNRLARWRRRGEIGGSAGWRGRGHWTRCGG